MGITYKIKPDNSKLSGAYVNPPYSPGTYTASDAVTDAINKAADASSAYDTKVAEGVGFDETYLKQYISDYEGRGKFNYDFNTDALYQQYKDKYIQQGKMAMADTMGQAAALTGGYGNSYAQTVGQQQYQASLGRLNDVIPELYQLAFDKYKQEGQELLDKIALERGEREHKTNEYNAEIERLLADRGYYQGIADTISAEDYAKWLDSETAKRTAWRDRVEDEQWYKNYDLSDRELKMAEEAWELENQGLSAKYQSGDSGGSGSTGGSGGGGGNNPVSTKGTTTFIGTHATQNEWLQRGGGGRTLANWKDYIKGQIEKATDLTDAEVEYLIMHYGLA